MPAEGGVRAGDLGEHRVGHVGQHGSSARSPARAAGGRCGRRGRLTQASCSPRHERSARLRQLLGQLGEAVAGLRRAGGDRRAWSSRSCLDDGRLAAVGGDELGDEPRRARRPAGALSRTRPSAPRRRRRSRSGALAEWRRPAASQPTPSASVRRSASTPWCISESVVMALKSDRCRGSASGRRRPTWHGSRPRRGRAAGGRRRGWPSG